MDTLTPDALTCVLRRLTWRDLLAASSSCRLLRGAVGPDLWRGVCRQRWHGPLNEELFPLRAPGGEQGGQQPASASYKKAFLQDRGWAGPPPLALQQWAGAQWDDELVAVAPGPGPDGGATLAVSSRCELRLLALGPHTAAQLQVQRAGRLGGEQAGGEAWSSLAVVSEEGGLVAAGGCHGMLALYRLPEQRSSGLAQAEATLAAPQLPAAPPNQGCLVSQLHFLPHLQRLAALHDPLSLMLDAPQQGALSLVDAATWRPAGPSMRDVLDGYELAAAVPAGTGAATFIAGSVKLSDDQASGWSCQRCPIELHAALCYHKSPASAAALCMFDCRAPLGMVARYATHHRSMYPHLETAREHYLFTSHAGTPVAVWDCRHMNGPLHEVQHIPYELDPRLEASLPLGPPQEQEPPTSQALHLSATDDLLLGRSDSGMCWVFDLSERLGWADGTHAGSWLRSLQGGGCCSSGGAAGMDVDAAPAGQGWEASGGAADGEQEEEGGYLDEHDFDRAPLPLGCIPRPYQCWSASQHGAAPLHWLPLAAAWVSHNRLVALGGLELEEKQALFPAHAQGSPYPSNALVVASLRAP